MIRPATIHPTVPQRRIVEKLLLGSSRLRNATEFTSGRVDIYKSM